MRSFKSYSGDYYLIPAEQYEFETHDYHDALERGDERKMMHYEEGQTGWIYDKNR